MPGLPLYIIIFLLPLISSAGNSRITLFISQQATDDARQGEKQILELGFGLYFDELYKLDTFELRMKSSLMLGTNFQYQKELNRSFYLPTDNVFNGDFSLRYKLGWALDPFISFSMNTAVMPAKRLSVDKITTTAKIFDPIVYKENLGFGYSYRNKKEFFTSRLGFSMKQIRAELYTLQTDDRTTKERVERYVEETGISWKTDATFMFDSIFTYRGLFDGFSTFEDLETWVVKFNNQLETVLYKALSIIIKVNLYYNRKQSINLQFIQSFRIGLIGKFN